MKLLKDLFFENDSLSMLRIIFMILMSIAIYTWIGGNAIPNQMMNFVYVVIGYIFGQKVIPNLKDKVKKLKKFVE